jgi:hypothetical protein
MSSASNTQSNQAGGWSIHVVGPDDVIPYDDELTALREANALNSVIEQQRRKYANDPNYPFSIAIVRRASNSDSE